LPVIPEKSKFQEPNSKEVPRSKIQGPSRVNSKFQKPNSKEVPNSKIQGPRRVKSKFQKPNSKGGKSFEAGRKLVASW